MDFLQIQFVHLKHTSATPGLSNPCKLRFKSNIAGIFKIVICRIVGDIRMFYSNPMLQIAIISIFKFNVTVRKSDLSSLINILI